jgi:ABC-2 type transport system permease protein
MTGVQATKLVMGREIRQRLKSKGFYIFTAVLCIGVVGIGVLNRALRDDASPTYDYAIIGAAPTGFDDALHAAADALDIDVRPHQVADRAAAEAGIRTGGLDVVVDTATGELLAKDTPPERLGASVNAAWQLAKSRQAAVAAGLDDAEVTAVVSPAPLSETFLEQSGDDDNAVGQVVGTMTAILLFISINAFGGMVLTGVVEEKTTGVVEVLLSHVRAHQLLAGKVLGIGTVAMMQFSAAIAAGVVALRVSGHSIPNEVWVSLPTTILWFVVGFVFYSTLYALAGSFVSRQEDAQGAAAPISIVFTAAYLAVFALGAAPASTATRIVSVLPPFAPLLMPLRIATGAASIVEIVLAAVLLLAATFGMLRVAGAVYARTLLHRGSRLGWRDALKMRFIS